LAPAAAPMTAVLSAAAAKVRGDPAQAGAVKAKAAVKAADQLTLLRRRFRPSPWRTGSAPEHPVRLLDRPQHKPQPPNRGCGGRVPALDPPETHLFGADWHILLPGRQSAPPGFTELRSR
jgi:hypothetical protein